MQENFSNGKCSHSGLGEATNAWVDIKFGFRIISTLSAAFSW
jgi:hypothetical protein